MVIAIIGSAGTPSADLRQVLAGLVLERGAFRPAVDAPEAAQAAADLALPRAIPYPAGRPCVLGLHDQQCPPLHAAQSEVDLVVAFMGAEADEPTRTVVHEALRAGLDVRCYGRAGEILAGCPCSEPDGLHTRP